jgi:uncharacterized protein (TIGR02145 family)
MKHISGFIIVIFFLGCFKLSQGQDVVKDIDGNDYRTIKIGSVVWMTGNLKVTRYQNGKLIPNIKEAKQWDCLDEGAYCDLMDNRNYSEAFGLLYNWYVTADKRNVCPAGWHVPSATEWGTLVSYLAGENKNAGNSLKVPGRIAPGMEERNKDMFGVLPEGFRGYDGEFTGIGYGGGGWWSGSEINEKTAYYFNVAYNTVNMQPMEGPKTFGYHIRCVKD